MSKLKNILFILLLSFISLPLLAQETDLKTIVANQGDINVHPIQHGTLALSWNDRMIYVDPTGGADAFTGLNDPDIIIITHAHGDHLSPETLNALPTQNAVLVMPQSVADELSQTFGAERVILANGESTQKMDIQIDAMPMYNLPEEGARHAKGWGNGYVLTMGEKRIYISGDTEGIPEMRSLENISAAFVCMNLPYTMDVQQASDAVLDFKPQIVYPYHHRGQDIEKFKTLVNAKDKSIEVRLLDWYSSN